MSKLLLIYFKTGVLLVLGVEVRLYAFHLISVGMGVI